MAKKKARKRKPARKATRRPAKKAARKQAKKPARKSTARRAAPKKAAAKKKAAAPAARKIRPGFISHTELASSDPVATKRWCQDVLGWKFGQSMPTPGGDYHMWSFGESGTGGGIRNNNPPEVPGSIPYCEVKNIQAAFDKALAAGATEMMAPTEIPGSGGSIAIVQAPGGVPIGFWGTK